MNNTIEEASVSAAIAEVKKKQFIKLVEQLARLRDEQYGNDMAENIVEDAGNVVALNLPSNILRAAAIFVDFLYGFPPDKGSFFPPTWVSTQKLLPESERGSLVCSGLKELCSLVENDVVVLLCDLPTQGLHAGMCGAIRRLPSEDNGEVQTYLIEFGEPDESITQKFEISAKMLRAPRPGDLLENYRS